MLQRGNVKVPIYQRNQTKKGVVYTSYAVPDHSSRRRKFWTFADLKEAKEKAYEIAHATHYGKSEVLYWQDSFRFEIRQSIDLVESMGMKLLPACQLFSHAVQILGGKSDEMLAACQHYVHNRSDKPYTPKSAKEAVREFLATKKLKISERRLRSLSSYVNRFADKFCTKSLHEIERVELQDFVDSYDEWAPKTHNDFLGGVSLLYREAQFRNWVPKDCNPAKTLLRKKVVRSTVQVFEPVEAKQILSRIDRDLVPLLVLWLFAGIRKEEISRMTWEQVNRGLDTGWIFMEAKQTKTGIERAVPVQDNLRAWLLKYRKTSGFILPDHLQKMSKIDEIPGYVSRKTGVQWKDNGPRHSFGTYFFKICKDPGEVVKAMGNSLGEFEKHYWCKARSITDEMARAWFAIMPDDADRAQNDDSTQRKAPETSQIKAAAAPPQPTATIVSAGPLGGQAGRESPATTAPP